MKPELYHEMAVLQAEHWWFVARRQILDALLRQLSLPADAAILEIGCGTGGNLALLASIGRVQAVESSAEARSYAEQLAVCPVESGTLPDQIPCAEGSFDLICMLDVLEHIEQDQLALAKVLSLLKPGGKLLVTVPAYTWLWSTHDQVHHHQRRYTASLLQQKASVAGFGIQRAGYFNSLLFPLIAAVRLFRKVTGLRGPNTDATMPVPWLNRLLLGVFALERHVVRRVLFPWGTTVAAVLVNNTPHKKI